ncbi:MAG: O-antigen ligase family protein [Cyclobacteriaceae bacterium]|nr:O-antigen ligase family protein [Cyclobacteriaceae bacterium]
MKPLIWLGLLIASYFFCLPLGRFTFTGIASDFRLFDFIILLFWLFNWNYLWPRLKFIYSRKGPGLGVVVALMVIIIVSLIFNFIHRGSDYIGPTLIRTYRFMAYLSTLAAVIAVVDNRKKFVFIFWLFYFCIFLQALLAFLQGIGVLDSFWPAYWRQMYAFNDAPVGTLSPHHKHIGVVMLIGVSLSLGLIYYFRNLSFKILFSALATLMLIIPLMGGTRTFLLGLAGVIIGLLWVTKGKSLLLISFMVVSFYLLYNYTPREITEVTVDRITHKYEQRVVMQYERGGVERLAVERTVIWNSVINALINYPYLFITGSGFQAAAVFILGNGSHNNFLQFLIETGIAGLVIFLIFLFRISRNLRIASKTTPYFFESVVARFVWVGFIGLIFTMFVGETFYAQAAMFTLAGQIMVFLALGLAPWFWSNVKFNKTPVYR